MHVCICRLSSLVVVVGCVGSYLFISSFVGGTESTRTYSSIGETLLKEHTVLCYITLTMPYYVYDDAFDDIRYYSRRIL